MGKLAPEGNVPHNFCNTQASVHGGRIGRRVVDAVVFLNKPPKNERRYGLWRPVAAWPLLDPTSRKRLREFYAYTVHGQLL